MNSFFVISQMTTNNVQRALLEGRFLCNTRQ
jgi:hypothetical protein